MTEARIEQTGQPAPDGAGAAALRIAVVGPTHPHTGRDRRTHDDARPPPARRGPRRRPRLLGPPLPLPAAPRRRHGAAGGVEVPEVPPFPRTIRALELGTARHLGAGGPPSARPRRHRRRARHPAGRPGTPRPARARRVPCRAPRVPRAPEPPQRHRRPDAAPAVDRRLPQRPAARAAPRRRPLMGLLLSRVDSVLVHSADQARLAHDLGARRVSVADLPPHVPGGRAHLPRSAPPARPGCSPSGWSVSTRASTCCSAPCAPCPR